MQENALSAGSFLSLIRAGYAFFDPGITGVKPGWNPYARALIMMHESIHLAGFGDAVFGASKQLTNILVENCYPAVKQAMRSSTRVLHT
jgi:hypothetical protein